MTELYLHRLLGEAFEVRNTANRGRGLYATLVPLGQPAVVFSESSLGRIIQVSPSVAKGLACALCGHVLGSPAWQLQKLTGLQRCAEGDVLNDCLSEIIHGRPLFSKTLPTFCSTGCHDEYERILGRLRRKRRLARRFFRYSRKVGCVFHMLALKLICWCVAEMDANPLKALCSRLYWEAIDMPSDPQAAQAFKVKLQKETETSRRLALKALGGLTDVPVGLKSFLEPMGYAKLLGALCCNCTVVAYVSPVLQHILQVDGMQECPAKTSAVRALEPWIRALKPPETNISDDEAGSGKASLSLLRQVIFFD